MYYNNESILIGQLKKFWGFNEKSIIFYYLINRLVLPLNSFADTVVYNTITGKYHAQSCASAKKCTVNCIKIDRKQAVQRGGVPCKICGAKSYW